MNAMPKMSETISVRLSQELLDQLAYKITIMEDDGCDPKEETIAAGYGFTDESLAAFSSKVNTARTSEHHLLPVAIELTELELEATIGEFENSEDIAHWNARHSDCAESKAFARRLKIAISRLKAVCEVNDE